ncbi:hypothetical protein CR513_44451, partial [Mucuna pruriens]
MRRGPEQIQFMQQKEDRSHGEADPSRDCQKLNNMRSQEPSTPSHQKPIRPVRKPGIQLIHVLLLSEESSEDNPPRAAPTVKLCSLERIIVLQLLSQKVAPNEHPSSHKPHTIVAHGSTTEQPAVMAAKPPSKPLHTSVTFQCPVCMRLPKSVVNAAEHPARVVVTAVLPMALHCP